MAHRRRPPAAPAIPALPSALFVCRLLLRAVRCPRPSSFVGVGVHWCWRSLLLLAFTGTGVRWHCCSLALVFASVGVGIGFRWRWRCCSLALVFASVGVGVGWHGRWHLLVLFIVLASIIVSTTIPLRAVARRQGGGTK
jgi:hypothetical protein